MSRHLLPLILLLPLAACQGNRSQQQPTSSSATEATPSASEAFDHDTVQTYDPQTREFQQKPPFGNRSNQAQ